jgi:hypothetical protein
VCRVAESLARREEPPLLADYVPETPVERMLDQVSALRESESAELASGDADLPALDSDTKAAYNAAYLLAGSLGARAQFELLQSQTIDLLEHRRALRLVRALADELIRHETLGGEDVRRVLERADGRDLTRSARCGRRWAIEPWPMLRRARVPT